MCEAEDELVWYCSYGSNLDEERFKKYIVGGPVRGSKRVERGCRHDKSLPRYSKYVCKETFAQFSSYFGQTLRSRVPVVLCLVFSTLEGSCRLSSMG